MRHARILWLSAIAFAITLASQAVVFAAPKPAEGHSEPSNLDIFAGALDLAIWTVVVFLILLFVLSKFAWKPMLEGLRKREQNIKGAVEEAKKVRAEMVAHQTEFDRKLAEAQQEIPKLLGEARRDAERLKEEMRAQAAADIQYRKTTPAPRNRSGQGPGATRDLEPSRQPGHRDFRPGHPQGPEGRGSSSTRGRSAGRDSRPVCQGSGSCQRNRPGVGAKGGWQDMTSDLKELVQQAQPDVSERHLARIYGESLLNAAEDQKVSHEVLEQLRELTSDLARRDPFVRAFFTSGVIGKERRETAIKSAFEGRGHSLVLNFLLVLNDHDRLNLFRTAVEELHKLDDLRRRRLRVRVESVVPIAERPAATTRR